MEFPDIANEKERVTASFMKQMGQSDQSQVHVIASPYRICPLGAHIDHQGGAVLGMTINAYTMMAFTSTDNGSVSLSSNNYPGRVSFSVDEKSTDPAQPWGIYAKAAIRALSENYPLKQGITGLVDGMLPGCGLSSSASVLLAYLYSFAKVNGLELSQWDYVNLTHKAEKEYIGLNNGILDQTSIVFGKQDQLLHIDTKEQRVTHFTDQASKKYRILVAFSGYTRELTTSGYNSRVDECREAARQLGSLSNTTPANLLSDIPSNDYKRVKNSLPALLLRRSEHFFNESHRVANGVKAWQEGRFEDFGSLMNQSCESSINSYECGMPAICDLHKIMSCQQGVLGSRFMGGGFGGCVVGLVKTEQAEKAAENVRELYLQQHPEVVEKAKVFLARSDDGVRFL